MPLILSGNVASATAPTTYDVANSCRFNDGDDPYMQKTPGSAGNRDRWTFSCWFKRGTLSSVSGVSQYIFTQSKTSSIYALIGFNTSDQINFDNQNSGDIGQLVTARKLRDCSAWYHLTVIWDSANGTAGDRYQIWINGVRETVFATNTGVDSGEDSMMNRDDTPMSIGAVAWAGTSWSNEFDGYLAECVFIDGLALAPTSFGEFDSDSPAIWKPIDVSGLTFGTNGFYLDFEASDNLGNDANGGTDLTEANLAAVDQATDTPTNNFCVLNPIDNSISNWTFLGEGNLEVQGNTTGGDYVGPSGTIGLTAGKWYWEGKLVTSAGAGSDIIGVTGTLPEDDGHQTGYYVDGYSYVNDGGTVNNASHSASWGATYDDDDIISVALDLTNLSIYFAKNGTWQDSGDPTSGATGTGEAYTVLAPALTKAGAYFPQVSEWSSAGQGTWQFNFGGCPAFAISSAAADGNGYGTFEYAPPSGYLAICTKNLGSDGG